MSGFAVLLNQWFTYRDAIRSFRDAPPSASVERGNAAARALLDFFSALLDERAAGTHDDLLSVLGAEDLANDEDRANVVANCIFFTSPGTRPPAR